MKIGLYGGSFDCPTLAHLQLAQSLLDLKVIDQVGIMPCYKHNFNKDLTDSIDREWMIRIAIQDADNKNIYFDGRDFNSLGSGKAIDIVKDLIDDRSMFTDYYYIIGLDCALEIHKWAQWEELIELIPFIVVSRKGYKSDFIDQWFLNSPHIFLPQVDIMDCSSSNVRKLFKEYYNGKDNKDEILQFITERIFNYITVKGVYKCI